MAHLHCRRRTEVQTRDSDAHPIQKQGAGSPSLCNVKCSVQYNVAQSESKRESVSINVNKPLGELSDSCRNKNWTLTHFDSCYSEFQKLLSELFNCHQNKTRSCSYGAIETVICSSQLMRCIGFSVIITSCEHLHWHPMKPICPHKNRSRNRTVWTVRLETFFYSCLDLSKMNCWRVSLISYAEKSAAPVAAFVASLLRVAPHTAPLCPSNVPIQSPVSPCRSIGLPSGTNHLEYIIWNTSPWQRPPWTETPPPVTDTCENITFANFVCGRKSNKFSLSFGMNGP